MTKSEYNQLQDTIWGLIEQEKRYCADYVAKNPDDQKQREFIKNMVISGMDIVLSTLKEQVKTGKIIVE